VALQSLLKQGALITLVSETRIVPAADTIYGLDPGLREPPAASQLRPGGAELFNEPRPLERRREDHPTDPDASRPATEELVTPD